MSLRRVVVDSDIILEHLRGATTPSVLRRLMGMFFCYTTVFQAAEVLAEARTAAGRQAAQDAMGAMKILGVNARGAVRYGDLMRRFPGRDRWNIMVAGLCLESRLPLVTGRPREFRRFDGLVVVPARAIRDGATADDVLGGTQRRG